MADTTDRAEDFEIGPDGKLRRKDGKQHPQLLKGFNRNADGSLRWDGGSSPSQAKGSLLSNVRTLVKAGVRCLGESPAADETSASDDLRSQSARIPVFESDAIRAVMGEPRPTPTALTPDRSVPVNMLFPDGPKRGDGGVETPRAKSRREARTPVFDAGPAATSATTSPKDSAGDARAKAQQASRTPVFDAGPDALLPKSTKGKLL